MSDFISEFLQGQDDHDKGIPHKSGRSSAYDRGYGASYELAAVKDNETLRQGDTNGA